MIEKSKALEKLYHEYTHLALGGKMVGCPYWENNLKVLIFGPFGGKGLPKQIISATSKAARKAEVNLKDVSSLKIKKFMEDHKIGIDCSGFVYHMSDALARERMGKSIFEFIEGVKGKGPRKVNAESLTNNKNSVLIKKIKDVIVGDIIRFQDGKHVAIILRVIRGVDKRPKEIIYAHSGRLSAITGVHTGRIKILNPKKDIGEQKWFEKTRKGYDFVLKYYSQKHGDSLRRLKIWA